MKKTHNYVLTFRDYVLCKDNKWRKQGFAENELVLDKPIDAQNLADEKRKITGKNIKIEWY